MKREPETQVLPALRRPQRRDIGLSLSRRPQRAGADRIDFAFVGDAEDREQAVAHEFQHLAALGLDRRREAVEEEIEQFDQRLPAPWCRRVREAAHVGEPDHRADRLAVAAPDPAGQNALAGVPSDIGVQQVDRGPAQPADLGDPRQRRADRLDRGDLPGREAARLARREGRAWISPLVKRSGIAR